MPADVPAAPPTPSARHRIPPPPKGDVPPPVSMDGGPAPADLPAPPDASGAPTPPTTAPQPPTPPTTGQPPAPPTPPTTPTPEPPAPPTPPTTPTTGLPETGPVTAFGPKNPLAVRYLSKFPPVVHVKTDTGDGGWTAYADAKTNSIQMVKGLIGKPFIVFTVTADQIAQANTLAGSPTIQNKLDLIKLFSTSSEKPFGPAPDGTWLKQTKLSPLERKLLHVGRISARIRWLFHKVDGVTNKIVQLYWGLQIKLWTIYSNKIVESILNEVWEEIDGELVRGQVEMVPGRKLDQLLSAAGVFVMYHDDDLSAMGPLCQMFLKRLKAEMMDLGDYPPATADVRKAAIQKRLDAIQALYDLISNG